ncbi:hypothetical protein M0657_009123 [Pyricularia oryzae]|nr:hypothetical protein M9X92_008966 [Pyricularia oryzae]KAI7915292.1 hypothetical protein M0657_009123 [Pyricularia oryzae]
MVMDHTSGKGEPRQDRRGHEAALAELSDHPRRHQPPSLCMTWHLGFLVLSLRQVAASAKVKPPKVPKTYLMLGVQAALWPCACGRSHSSLVKMHMESLAHYATEISRTGCESIE